MTVVGEGTVAVDELPGLLGPGSRVGLVRLAIGPLEHGEHEVGTADGSVFVGLPPVGVTTLQQLAQGASVGEAVERAAQAGCPDLDVAGFVAGLASYGFVTEVDNRGVGGARWSVALPRDDAGGSTSALGEWFPWKALSPERMSRCGTPAWRRAWMILSFLVVVATPAWFATHPTSFPTPDKVWIGGSVDAFLNWTIFVVIGWVLVLLHEMGHVLALRSLGEDASLSISHRLFYLVVQTNMRRARALPRRLRYAPYVAGMVVDLAVMLAAGMAYVATGEEHRLFIGIAYIELFGVTWQFAVFMRTDLYFVITNALAVGDLMGTMRLQLLAPWRRWRRARGVDQPGLAALEAVPDRERRLGAVYAVLCVLGFALVTWVVTTLNYPLLVRFLLATRGSIQAGPGASSFWTACAFLTVMALYWSTFALVGLRWLRARWSPELLRRP